MRRLLENAFITLICPSCSLSSHPRRAQRHHAVGYGSSTETGFVRATHTRHGEARAREAPDDGRRLAHRRPCPAFTPATRTIANDILCRYEEPHSHPSGFLSSDRVVINATVTTAPNVNSDWRTSCRTFDTRLPSEQTTATFWAYAWRAHRDR